MHRPVEFSKLSGSGNDFICIDNRDGSFDELLADRAATVRLARTLCRRGLSVGADGIIFASPSEVGDLADVMARFVEADGSEAELCGNGTACFTRWILDLGWPGSGELRILTGAGVVRGSRTESDYIKVCIPFLVDRLRDQELFVCGRKCTYDYAVTGVPHVVTYVKDIDAVNVAELGPGWRHHPHFAPRGVNANFVEHVGEGRIAIRTFEFGVEAETFACGTGSATAAYFAARRFGWPQEYLRGQRPILVTARSGDLLKVWITVDDRGEISDLCLETVVRYVYRGQLDAQMQELALGAALEPQAEPRG